MGSSTGIFHCPLDMGFIPRGRRRGGDVLVSKPQLCLRRKLIFPFPKPAPSSSTRTRPFVAGTDDVTTSKTAPSPEEEGRFRWAEVRHNQLTEQQRQAISKLPFKMARRCKAVMRQLICFSPEKGSLEEVLDGWVSIMKPERSDWLSVLKQLDRTGHPFYTEVAELALLQDSFEANIRDYTKLIHYYGKQSRIRDAENTFLAMKERGLVCDQVTLTAFVHMYSKAGNLKKAEEAFEALKLLGEPLDSRSYGSIIMAYIRAGMPNKGEAIILELDDLEVRAGSEVYKALLRAYSMAGDCEGAQRVFNAIQFVGIPPDEKVCALLINAYQMAGETEKARVAFDNMKTAGLEPNDKCVALLLAGYEKENKLNEALDLLVDMEKEGTLIGKEASKILARWLGRLGVLKEVELVLREYATSDVLAR